ncbi:trafficking protein particle complex subunit 5-like [Stegodyphus dumicola]|uniref:trafficking protein particle complex subunit 5-like n=1 Tax=Stegodyphus dumicola TaxID=202533 RepID=UPI0015B0FFA0|nr:trafficking protein particle complex subunit 5-like [Stegodyphus dumicola]
MSSSRQAPKISILDKPLSKGKAEINISTYALLFSEIVQYCQNRVLSVPELQAKLGELGYHVGQRMVDTLFVRERNFKRETKLINLILILIIIKAGLLLNDYQLYGYFILEILSEVVLLFVCFVFVIFIIENEPLVNKFISIPKDKGSLNCAAFIAGIIEATLVCCNFAAKVTAHWHKGTTFKIIFDESVVARNRSMDGK